MKMTVTEAAVAWFKEEWGCQEGDSIRFFVRYGGVSTVQDSFSMGIAKELPNEIGLSTEIDGITFYMEQDELWYMNGKGLIVDYRPATDEVDFRLDEQ
ncbi:HesB/YadR/YfhF family protein [Brevibacillus parabrevis]|uniref:HesB/YadR/YfhF family protein n=1 Tax=Brevibacillus parabrevis TaxID=54914 RepID=UPI0028D2FF34|nr:HesB/YadR/YfhF family protein [Brevibacillus parabrevis]